MKKREADFTVFFRHWLRANPMYSSAFELKHTPTNTISFDRVKNHQIDALLASKGKTGFLYKAPDDSRGIKPFDLFYLKESFAWIVIKFPKHFEIIDVETFLKEKKKSKVKSLTSKRAKEISTISVNI